MECAVMKAMARCPEVLPGHWNNTGLYPLNENENTVLVNYLKKNFEGNLGIWVHLTTFKRVNGFGLIQNLQSDTLIGHLVNWTMHAGDGEDCLNIYKPFGWMWNDISCNIPNNYVCQQ